MWRLTLVRMLQGLWHAKYIEPAKRILPYCKLAHIGVSPSIATKFFWSACSAFSLNYATLIGKEGQEFRKRCNKEGKELYVWTVNDRKQMIQAIKWGASVVLTDRTSEYLTLRGEMSSEYSLFSPYFTQSQELINAYLSDDLEDWSSVSKEVDSLHAWSNLYYYTPINEIYKAWNTMTMHRSAGPMPKSKYGNKAADKSGASKAEPTIVQASNSDTSI